MKILIIKLGASGDVVRTTSLLNVLKGEIDWITAPVNTQLLNGLSQISHVSSDENYETIKNNKYDLVINLEDSFEAAELVSNVKFENLFGAYLNKSGKIEYTENSKAWFDLSLISKYGIEKANILKYENQISFQELVFDGLGFKFNGEPYLLPKSPETELFGDIAISPKAGKVWPMKNWKYYDELASVLKDDGFIVNYLPQRTTMLEHLSDVRNHKFLISGDSLPMHFALGSNVKCISLFICTSASEIFDYGIQKKIVSKDLEKYFYRRDFDPKAIESITLNEVVNEFKILQNM
jgi:heptosyltransferase-2